MQPWEGAVQRIACIGVPASLHQPVNMHIIRLWEARGELGCVLITVPITIVYFDVVGYV